jgi:hypothetical protein
MTSKSIDGAANASRSTVEDMGIDHRRFNIIMAQEFLDRPDIVTAFEQLSGKGSRNVWQVARFVNPAFVTASLTAF